MSLLLLLLIIILHLTTCLFSISITSPPSLSSLFNNLPIQISPSSFGHIPHGKSLPSKLFFNPINDNINNACFHLTDQPHFNSFISSLTSSSPFCVLSNFGDCTFLSKAKNIQLSGAQCAILINDTPEEPIESVLISDYDYKGNDITIPVIVMNYENGTALKQFIFNNNSSASIDIILNFEIQNKTDKVDVNIWYSADDEQVYKLFTNMSEYYNVLVSSSNFVTVNIHVITYKHMEYNEYSNVNNKYAFHNCYGSGKYCMQQNKLGINDGRVIVKEDIRQKCVYAVGDDYMKYMKVFYKECVCKGMFNEECAENVMLREGIRKGDVNKCISDSFINANVNSNNDDDYYIRNEFIMENEILNSEYKIREINYVEKSPTVFINKRLYFGNINSNYIIEAICAHLTKPIYICHNNNTFITQPQHYLTLWFGIIIMSIFVLVLSGAFLTIKYLTKHKHKSKTKIIISSELSTLPREYISV